MDSELNHQQYMKDRQKYLKLIKSYNKYSPDRSLRRVLLNHLIWTGIFVLFFDSLASEQIKNINPNELGERIIRISSYLGMSFTSTLGLLLAIVYDTNRVKKNNSPELKEVLNAKTDMKLSRQKYLKSENKFLL